MPKKASGNFDQLAYIKEWNKKNQKKITFSYRDSFIQEFKESCKKLGVSQSSIVKEAMQAVIDKAKNIEE